MKQKTRRYLYSICFICSIYFSLFSNVSAGRLDSFEQSINESSKTQKNNSNDNTSSISEEDCEGDSVPPKCIAYSIARSMIVGIWNALIYEGHTSLAMVNSASNAKRNRVLKIDFLALNALERKEDPWVWHKVHLRTSGEAKIPHARFDVSYQRISANISAKDFRLTLGYGPFAFQINQTQYSEKKPDDTLDLTRVYLAYRMAFSLTQLDIGLGRMTINGNNTTQKLYFTMPIRFHISAYIKREFKLDWRSNIGVEFKPAWTNSINDYDLGFFYDFRYMSIKTGYRWLSAGGESLNGPYAGITLYY